MEIRPNDLEQANRRGQKLKELRSAERLSAVAGTSQQTASEATDSSQVRLDPSEAAKYVELLKNMDHRDQKKLDDLRRKIEDGSYRAEVDDLVQPLLQFLGRAGG